MKRFTELLSGSAAMLFQVALTGWMFALSEINFDFESMGLNYLWLSAVMLAAYYINMVIMRRGVSVPVLAIINTILVAAGAYVFVKSVYLVPFQLRTVIINCIIYCLGFAVAAFIAWSPTNQNGILLRFDGLAVMCVLLIVLDEILVLPGAGGALGMCFVCLALSLLAAISIKSGALMGRGGAVEGNAALGRILLFVLFGILGALALVVIIFAASGFKSFSQFLLNIINAIVGGVKAVLRFLYEMLERFVTWLAQFFDDAPMAAVGMEPGADMNLPPGEEAMGSLPSWIYYVLIAIAVAAIVYIIFRLRKVRTTKVVRKAVVVTSVRRESGLKKALKELWERLRTELRFRYNCLRYGRSAPGMLVWCEKHAAEGMGRKTHESGQSFLRRLGTELGGESEKNLAELALLVERSFYSPKPATLPQELYRAIKKTKFKVEKSEA